MKVKLALLLLVISAIAGAQSIHINDAGTLREITGVYVNDAGTLREIQEGWINDAGTLRQFYASTTLGAGSGGSVTQIDPSGPYNSSVAIRFNIDGTIETGKSRDGALYTWTDVGNWITPTSAASNNYDVRFTNFDGSGGGDWTTEAAADDVWTSLVDASRTWQMNITASGVTSFTCDFEVRDGGGAPPDTASASYTFNITNTL